MASSTTDASPAIRRVTTPAGHPAWLVTRYDDVKALLSDPRLGRSHPDPARAARVWDSAIFGGPIGDPATEAAEHALMRRLLSGAFSARRMAALRPRVRAITDELLDELAARTPPADFHESVSFPLPALVICELLGVPYADREDFRRWSDDAAHKTDAARSMAGLQRLWGYMCGLVDLKRQRLGEDVISDLIRAGDHDPTLTDDGIAQLTAGLLFAGHETTVAAIDRGVTLLLTNPDQYRVLRSDPALVRRAVEEILRSPSPVETPQSAYAEGLPRYAATDLDCGGVTIRAGDLVLLDLAAANQDRYRFPRPERFDISRQDNPHLTFGHGHRFCLGAPLARTELQVLFASLVHRFPTLRLAVAPERLRPRSEQLTGSLVELPVTW